MTRRFNEKLKFDGFDDAVCEQFKDTSFLNYFENVLQYFDGVNISSEDISPEIQEVYDAVTAHKLDFVAEEQLSKELSDFYDKVIQEPALA